MPKQLPTHSYIMPKYFINFCIFLNHHPHSSVPLWLLLRASNMKTKASTLLKQVVSVIVTVLKAKSVAVKNKTSAMKTRLLVFGLLHNKKVLMSSISHKIHALMMGQENKDGDAHGAEEDNSKAILLYKVEEELLPPEPEEEEGEDDDDPDLRHCLFDSEEDVIVEDEDDALANGTGSVIDLVRNAREEGADFSLEDEIDHVADVFIKRFHKQMKMQKLQSFKRHQEMLARAA